MKLTSKLCSQVSELACVTITNTFQLNHWKGTSLWGNPHCLSCNSSLAITAPATQQNSHRFSCLKPHLNQMSQKETQKAWHCLGKKSTQVDGTGAWDCLWFGYNLTLLGGGWAMNEPSSLGTGDCIKSQDETWEGLCSKLSLPQHKKAGKVTSCCITDGQRDCED